MCSYRPLYARATTSTHVSLAHANASRSFPLASLGGTPFVELEFAALLIMAGSTSSGKLPLRMSTSHLHASAFVGSAAGCEGVACHTPDSTGTHTQGIDSKYFESPASEIHSGSSLLCIRCTCVSRTRCMCTWRRLLGNTKKACAPTPFSRTVALQGMTSTTIAT